MGDVLIPILILILLFNIAFVFSVSTLISRVQEGAAAVSIRGRWGFLDRKGKFFIPPSFEGAGAFSEGLAAVQSADKWGYIDKNGAIQAACQF